MGEVRHPRCYIEIGGRRIPCTAVQVSRKAERAADTFTATFPANAALIYAGMSLNDFADWQPQDVSVIASTGGSGGKTLVTGRVDMPTISWKEMVISLEGRDKSSLLTEKRRSEKFANQKSKDVVEKIAKEHGLTASHSSEGTSETGKKYDTDAAFLALDRTDYDILNDLAEKEGARWYVEGSTLYFEPKNQDKGTALFTYVPPTPGRTAEADVLDLRTWRDMDAARPVEMTVKSWHSNDKKLHEHTEKVDGVGEPLKFEHHHNGRQLEQIEALAKARIKNAIRHDLGFSVNTVADFNVSPRMKAKLSGTGTIYDQEYQIDSVDFEVSWDNGATMDVTCNSAKSGRGG